MEEENATLLHKYVNSNPRKHGGINGSGPGGAAMSGRKKKEWEPDRLRRLVDQSKEVIAIYNNAANKIKKRTKKKEADI